MNTLEKQAVINKLASVQQAICYVLRQRLMSKHAYSASQGAPQVSFWDALRGRNPYGEHLDRMSRKYDQAHGYDQYEQPHAVPSKNSTNLVDVGKGAISAIASNPLSSLNAKMQAGYGALGIANGVWRNMQDVNAAKYNAKANQYNATHPNGPRMGERWVKGPGLSAGITGDRMTDSSLAIGHNLGYYGSGMFNGIPTPGGFQSSWKEPVRNP